MKLLRREDDEKICDDEVEYEPQEKLRNRLQKYKYLKSFIKNDWNVYDSLPDFYQKLFIFEDIERIKKRAKELHKEGVFALENFYVYFVFPKEILSQLPMGNSPFILSSLFKHERKMTLNHCVTKFHNLCESQLQSKQDYTVHAGFRKYRTNILFSNIYPHVSKYKYCKKVDPDPRVWHIASFYQQLYFTPCHSLIFQKNPQSKELGELVMLGTFLNPDPFKVLLKRIVLTGYPFKIKKKHAVVRYMFFNPEDVVYFKKNEVYTKKGLKGKIKESLGTHGLMKTQFNGFIKQNDTVCMNLYKRVFPQFLYK